MDKSNPSGVKTLAIVAAHLAAYLMIGSAFALPELFLPIIAIPAGALFVWLTARLTNRHDDPRHVRRTPEAP